MSGSESSSGRFRRSARSSTRRAGDSFRSCLPAFRSARRGSHALRISLPPHRGRPHPKPCDSKSHWSSLIGVPRCPRERPGRFGVPAEEKRMIWASARNLDVPLALVPGDLATMGAAGQL
eukprot:1924880-Pyramimonas_sp.AAC.1